MKEELLQALGAQGDSSVEIRDSRGGRSESRDSRIEETGDASAERRDSSGEIQDASGEIREERAREPSAEQRLRQAREHLDSLYAQAADLRREFPDFDLEAALGDADFVRLTAPGLGVDLRRAYYALNRSRLDERAARRGAEESGRLLTRALASGGSRPREGGGQQAAGLIAADYRHLSRSQQQDLKQRILEAAARGEKLYP